MSVHDLTNPPDDEPWSHQVTESSSLVMIMLDTGVDIDLPVRGSGFTDRWQTTESTDLPLYTEPEPEPDPYVAVDLDNLQSRTIRTRLTEEEEPVEEGWGDTAGGVTLDELRNDD